MAALDVGNGPVEGHENRPMVSLALVKNGSRRAVPRTCDLPLQADLRRHATAPICGDSTKGNDFRMPIMRIGWLAREVLKLRFDDATEADAQ
jgi:hypothetical protein